MEDKKALEEEKNEETMKIPDMAELWKEMYFKTEETWANTVKQTMSTKLFIDMLTTMRDQYLSYEKINKQTLDKYFETNPVPSKKDIARVAELVIALEEKIDDFDIQFSGNINSIAESLLKLVDYQSFLKNEIETIKNDVNDLNNKLDRIEKKINTLSKSIKEKNTESNSTKTRKKSNKNNEEELQEGKSDL